MPATATASGPTQGDWSDGDVTTSGDLLLSRDMYYKNLVVSLGDTISTGGFRIYADVVAVLGTIANVGGDAVADAHGVGGDGPNGTATNGGSDGGDGVTASIISGDVAGNDGVPGAWYGDESGVGGTGGVAGAGPAGAGGQPIVSLPNWGGMRGPPSNLLGGPVSANGAVTPSSGGTGGGSGSSEAPLVGSAISGGGGGGGGVVLIACRIFKGNGLVTVKGGKGGDGTSNNAGGGGGGGGGIILITAADKSGWVGTYDVSGGAGGAGSGTGLAGNSVIAPTSGHVITFSTANM